MSKIRLLDCTLRDGGYINDWKFGFNVIRNMLSNLVDASIDVVEVGFLKNCVYDQDASCFNNIAEIKKVLPIYKKNTKFAAMILYTNYDLSKLEDNDGTLDYLRVTFHNYDYESGIQYCEQLKKKGYKIFVNPINIMGYRDAELVYLIQQINNLKPYGMSIVDTFGSMTKRDLMRIYSIIENNLDKDIVVGIHLHDNTSMAFSLAQYFLDIKSPKRQCVIDGSLYGMGRKPGNLCIELISDYLCEVYGKKYQIECILDAIENYIYPINRKNGWGYSIEYFLSAKNNIHRNYAEYYQKKGRLTSKAINNILKEVEISFASRFDDNYAEHLYREYIFKNEIDDAEDLVKLREIFKGKSVVLLAPGPSSLHIQIILEKIKTKGVIIVAANHVPPSISPTYVFFSNMKRFEEYKEFEMHNLILTSNIDIDVLKPEYYLDLKKLSMRRGEFSDSCGILLLRLMEKLEPKQLFLVGFDGYTNGNFGYYKGHFGDFVLAQSDDINFMKKEMDLISQKIKLDIC